MASPNRPIRLIIEQPTLTKYRVPVFRELAERDGIALKLFYGSRPGWCNVPPEGFEAEPRPLWDRHIFGNRIAWQQAQWEFATRRHTDVLLLQWNVRYLSLIPALLRAKSERVPTILWGHGFSKNDRPWRSNTRLSIAKLATALLVYNQTTAQKYVASGWDPQQIFVALNSLDQSSIQRSRQAWLNKPDRLRAFRREQKLTSGPLVLFISRLDPARRLDLLWEAAQKLSSKFPMLQVIVIGKGDAEQTRLKELGQHLGVADRVRFIGPVYDEMELAPWFLSADLLCFPSHMGLSVLHAFGYGLPVITSDCLEMHGPEVEALQHGENGLLFAHENSSSLANMINSLVTDRQRAEKMSAAALATVTKTFTIEKMVDGMAAAVFYCARMGGNAFR